MCWKNDLEYFKLQISKKDIGVYKVICWDTKIHYLRSWFYKCNYLDAFKSAQYSKISFEEVYNFVMGSEGFHSYIMLPYIYNDGISANYSFYKRYSSRIPLVVKCYIPKNALYASNGKEVISSAIKFEKIIPISELVHVIGTTQDLNFEEEYNDAYEYLCAIINSNKKELI
jgi:hypothetical protein